MSTHLALAIIRPIEGMLRLANGGGTAVDAGSPAGALLGKGPWHLALPAPAAPRGAGGHIFNLGEEKRTFRFIAFSPQAFDE
jgi:hypothetical protein